MPLPLRTMSQPYHHCGRAHYCRHLPCVGHANTESPMMRTGKLLLGAALAAVAGSSAASAAPAAPVDLVLVIAADTSQSIDDREAALERQGVAAAFRSPEVLRAISSGALGRIAVLY